MKSSAAKIQMASADELLFGLTEESGPGEKVREISLSELYPFNNHPFHVLDDEKMRETVESIQKYGVLVPAIARPRAEGGYELVAGHRRKRASELAEKATMPVLVRTLDDDAATIIMVDSNIQRENLLPSEKAWAYKMKLEALKRQGERTDLTSAPAVPKLNAREQVAQDAGEKSGMAVTRYISLTKLLPALLEAVDAGDISVSTAADFLSDLTVEEQDWLLAEMGRQNGLIPTRPQCVSIKKFSEDGTLTQTVIKAILTAEHPAPLQVTLKSNRLKQYFPQEYTQTQVEEVIFSLLERWRSQNVSA